MLANKKDNILIRGVNWVGDAVMTMPAIRSVRKAFPEANISLLVKPWVAPLFELDPNIDQLIIYADEYAGLAGKLRLSSIIRQQNFSRAILLQNAFDAALLSFLAGIPERVGYGRDGRGFLLTKSINPDKAALGLHHIDYYLDLLEKAGVKSEKSDPWIYFDIDERVNARERLACLKRPVIGINPGAAYGSSKRWPPERFADISRRIIEEMKGSVLIFGGPAEVDIGMDIFHRIGRADTPDYKGEAHVMNLAGKTGLRELAALISECDALVTNDSGPMHIGYAVGTPLVAVFGSTSPELTGPPATNSIVIKGPAECSPCFERTCRYGNLKCMDVISADDVFEAVGRLAGSRRAVFFDRDGTLCRDAHYLSRMEDFELFPDIGAVQRLKEQGFLLIGISNQSGIARGLIKESFVKEVNDIFSDKHGFDGFYYCPHHPDERCSCRKPEPGLLFKARREFRVDLKKSFVVGDKDADMLLAKAVGAVSVHVNTGQAESSDHADYAASGLQEAVDIILKQTKQRP